MDWRYPDLVFLGDVYRPSDDTWLILELLRERNPRGDICVDLGAGSGILGLSLILNNLCRRIVFIDISSDAVETTLLNTLRNNVRDAIIVQTDSISIRDDIVDIVVANPPYLPVQNPGDVDTSTEGGSEGYEVIEYFLEYSSLILKDNGFLYLVYSSFSKPEVVEELITKYGFKTNYSKMKHFFFETLYAVECVRVGRG